ncbi:uncharacterized protein Dyak_GE23277, isoform B [Drosophila yakuba]|uniref:Uncharacterized protein, isoform A n=1 Tax=Drosophila yakuba TaxID=7245 RepID=B4IUN4_DROYA|nr:uncharacterized protein Dyak_GE23277, isoform A [Drosophila yakuba]KRK05400.1 uncharacterized protein Dyak_GE23277, isoform B [Drosophila yakuba]
MARSGEPNAECQSVLNCPWDKTDMSAGDYESGDYFMRSRKHRDKPSLWDSFQDPPSKKTSGSDADWKKLQFCLKLFKLCIYLLVFAVVLATSVFAKVAYLYMAGNTGGTGPRVQVCSKYRE